MGQFSWITQDTGEAIRECYGCNDGNLTTAYMHDNKGNVWEEKSYEGYGVFGGKDYYQLLAEMNNAKGLTGDVDNDRLIGINLFYGTSSIRHKETGKIYKSRGIDFTTWDEILPHGMSANDSVDSGEWERITIKEENILSPNLTRNKKWGWIEETPDDDPNQGWGCDEEEEDEEDYFEEDYYGDEDEEDEY